MRESLQTLWDLLKETVTGTHAPVKLPLRSRRARPPISSQTIAEETCNAGPRKQPAAPDRAVRARAKEPTSPAASPKVVGMAERYDAMTRDMLQLHGVRVRRWRTSMSGIAWQIRYKDGRVTKLIESPRPKGPMSAAVFLHEIGHHAIGFNVYKPRCLEEYHAWFFSIQQMEALGLNVTDAVRRRMHQSLRYAVQKAQRRGIKALPPELAPYTQPWKASRASR
jgi:hypothetical protein